MRTYFWVTWNREQYSNYFALPFCLLLIANFIHEFSKVINMNRSNIFKVDLQNVFFSFSFQHRSKTLFCKWLIVGIFSFIFKKAMGYFLRSNPWLRKAKYTILKFCSEEEILQEPGPNRLLPRYGVPVDDYGRRGLTSKHWTSQATTSPLRCPLTQCFALTASKFFCFFQ